MLQNCINREYSIKRKHVCMFVCVRQHNSNTQHTFQFNIFKYCNNREKKEHSHFFPVCYFMGNSKIHSLLHILFMTGAIVNCRRYKNAAYLIPLLFLSPAYYFYCHRYTNLHTQNCIHRGKCQCARNINIVFIILVIISY